MREGHRGRPRQISDEQFKELATLLKSGSLLAGYATELGTVEMQEVRRLSKIRKVASQVDSMSFFNLLSGPELLEKLEALLPEYRERKYPPMVTLAMFLGQVLSADGSCRNAVNQAQVNQLLRGIDASGAGTSSYCEARERLTEELVRELAREIGRLLMARTPRAWKWLSVFLIDRTDTFMCEDRGLT